MPRTITAEAFADLVADLTPSDIAIASSHELEALARCWTAVTDVKVAPEHHTFHASGTAAAMQVELTIVFSDGDPVVRRGSICAVIADGRIQLARVDVEAPSELSRRDAVIAKLAAAKNQEFDGKIHLTNEDADEIIALLRAA